MSDGDSGPGTIRWDGQTTPRTAAGRAHSENWRSGGVCKAAALAIEAAIRAAALDEAREAIGRVVTYGRAVAKESYVAAIDALRERSGE